VDFQDAAFIPDLVRSHVVAYPERTGVIVDISIDISVDSCVNAR